MSKVSSASTATAAIASKFVFKCQCGKVCGTIQTLVDAPQPLRLVCYCKDCRGYYNTLNTMASRMATSSRFPPAMIDEWGGVDWLCIYPRDIQIETGKAFLTTCKIRPTSPIKQVYSTCCYTPIFRFGSMSVLMNTHIMEPPKQHSLTELPDVKFRIMGRQSLPGSDQVDRQEKKPNISWSIPVFSWLWTMSKRVKAELMVPMPFDDNDDMKKIFPKAIDQVPVLDQFQEG